MRQPLPSSQTAPAQLFELLFSSRAAFVWDHTDRRIPWMNAAARAYLGPDALDASVKPLRRHFAAFLRSGSAAAPAGTVQWAPRGQQARPISLQRWTLANGHEGLIAQELDEEPLGRCPTAPKATERPAKPRSGPSGRLTEDELQSFKAIGRQVRRLSQERDRRARMAASPPAAPQAPARAPTRPTADFVKPLLAAFDATFLLDEDYAIQKLESGKLQRLGLRWRSIKGRPAREIIQPQSLGAFDRMAARLSDSRTGIAKEAVVLQFEGGPELPCRAVIGRWPAAGGMLFLALLSLEMPSRVKRRFMAAETARRAA